LAQSHGEPLEGADLVLLMLAAQGQPSEEQGRVNGITRLEKLMYLADRESELPKSVHQPLEFAAYHYGPYSKQIYEAVEILERAGLVEERRVSAGQVLDSLEDADSGGQDEAEYVERQFLLTDDGRAVAQLLGTQNPNLMKVFGDIKHRFSSIPLHNLLRYVYRTYPESAEKSKIRDQILQ